MFYKKFSDAKALHSALQSSSSPDLALRKCTSWLGIFLWEAHCEFPAGVKVALLKFWGMLQPQVPS